MFIQVKMMDDEGNVKGKAYTYQSNFDVSVGQDIVADFGGKERILKVVEINAEDKSNGEFEIKHIKALAKDKDMISGQEVINNESLEIKVVQEISPVITINFEELKAGLSKNLEEYKGFIVTEQNLGLCKAKQKELAGLRNTIEKYRKKKKKTLSKPIVDFEMQCKELVGLITQVETPIKKCIVEFDDVKRNEKRKIAIGLIQEVIEETGLTEKYASQLTVNDRYCNLTAKVKEVKADLQQRAFALKVEQDREQEVMDIINDAIESENNRINKKLSIKDFERYIKMGMQTKEILSMIRNRANAIYEAENPKPIEIVQPEIIEPEVTKHETIQPVQSISIPKQQKEEINVIEVVVEDTKPIKRYRVSYIVQGTLEELRGISSYLQANNITYEPANQKEI